MNLPSSLPSFGAISNKVLPFIYPSVGVLCPDIKKIPICLLIPMTLFTQISLVMEYLNYWLNLEDCRPAQVRSSLRTVGMIDLLSCTSGVNFLIYFWSHPMFGRGLFQELVTSSGPVVFFFFF